MADEKTKVIYELDASDYIEGQNKMQKETKETSGTIGKETEKQTGFFKNMSLKSVLSIGAVTLALKSVISFMVSAAKETERYTRAMLGLDSVASAMGQDGGSLQETAKEIETMTKGMVSAEQAAQGLKFLISSGFSTDQASEMSKAMLNVGAFNRVVDDLGQAFADSSKGIKTGSIELIENIGLTQKLSQVMKDAGIDTKNGIDITNNAAQRQALYNVILAEGEKFTGNLDKATQGYAGTMAEAGNILDKLTRKVGSTFQPIIGAFAKTFTSIFKPFVEEDAPKASESLAELIVKVRQLQSITNPTAEDTENLKKAMNEISVLSPDLVTGYDNQGNAITNLDIITQGLLETKTKELELEKSRAEEVRKAQNAEIDAEIRKTIKMRDEAANRRKTEKENWDFARSRGIEATKQEVEDFETRQDLLSSQEAAYQRQLNQQVHLRRETDKTNKSEIERINEVIKKLNEKNVVEMSKKPITTTGEDGEVSPDTEKPFDKKIFDARLNLEKKYRDALFDITANGLEKINKAEREALEEAERLGVEKLTIEQFFREKRQELINKQAEDIQKGFDDEIEKTEAKNKEVLRLNEILRKELEEIEIENKEEDRQIIEEALAYRDEVAQREIELKEKANKEMTAEDWARLKDEEAAQSIRQGMQEAQLQLAQDLINGETKSLAAYASIIGKKLQLEMVSSGIEAGVMGLKEVAYGLAATARKDVEAAKDHFNSARTFAMLAAKAGVGAVAAGAIASGGGGGGTETETPTAEQEQEVADVTNEKIENPQVVNISEEDFQRMRFGMVDEINEALSEGKALKVVSR